MVYNAFTVYLTYEVVSVAEPAFLRGAGTEFEGDFGSGIDFTQTIFF